jgi:hypothetical protein
MDQAVAATTPRLVKVGDETRDTGCSYAALVEEVRRMKLSVAAHELKIVGLRSLRDKDNRNILNPNWDDLENEIGFERLSNSKTNLLDNGRFNLWDSTTVPSGWTITNAPTISQQAVRTGGDSDGKSCRIASGGSAGSISRTVYARASSKYKLAGWIKMAASASVTITLTTDGGTPVVVPSPPLSASAQGTDWLSFPRPQLDIIDIETPSDATTITVKLEVDANHTCDFSDFQLIRGVRCDADLVESGRKEQAYSGTYTPTATGVLNITTVTPGTFWYTRVGDVVHLGGTVQVDPVAAGVTTYRLSLPVASAFSAATQATGTTVHAQVAGLCGEVQSVAATDDLLVGFISPDGTNRSFSVTGSYMIL